MENSIKTTKEMSNLNKAAVSQIVQAAHISFSKWHVERERKKYLVNVAESFATDKELSQLIHYWAALSSKVLLSAEQNPHKELFANQTKKPIGVISIFINDTVDVNKTLVSLITPAIALGNTVIVVTIQENRAVIKPLIQVFNRYLPANVLLAIDGAMAAHILAADPNVDVSDGSFLVSIKSNGNTFFKNREKCYLNETGRLTASKTYTRSLGLLN